MISDNKLRALKEYGFFSASLSFALWEKKPPTILKTSGYLLDILFQKHFFFLFFFFLFYNSLTSSRISRLFACLYIISIFSSFSYILCLCRVESFIEHQDACNMGRVPPESQPLQPACLSRTASSPSPSSETNFSTGCHWPSPLILPKPMEPTFLNPAAQASSKKNNLVFPNLELQLSTTTPSNIPIDVVSALSPKTDEARSTHLQLSIGSSDIGQKNNESNCCLNIMNRNNLPNEKSHSNSSERAVFRVQEEAREQLKIAMAEKAYADEARKQAKRQIELAEQEFTNAKRIRQEAQAELGKAFALKEHAIKQISSTMLQITCHACKLQFQARTTMKTPPDENSFALSYMSSVVTTEGGGEVENDNGKTTNS